MSSAAMIQRGVSSGSALPATRRSPCALRSSSPRSLGKQLPRLVVCGATQPTDTPLAPSPPPASPPPPPPPSGSLLERALGDAPSWASFLGTMAYSGVFMGPLLDGIHSRVGLQVYDVAPLVFGGLRTSALVPVLLAVFYAVLGALHPLADNLSPSPETESVRQRSSDVLYVALTFGALAGLLYLSATLYDQGVPYWQIHAILGTATIINWRIFDGTRQGLILAAVCGLGAPAAEALLLQIAPLWHYPRADVGGFFVSWVCWCYAFYTPSVGNTARYAWNLMRDIEKAQQEYRRGMAQTLEQQRLGQPPQPQQPPAQQEDKPQR